MSRAGAASRRLGDVVAVGVGQAPEVHAHLGDGAADVVDLLAGAPLQPPDVPEGQVEVVGVASVALDDDLGRPPTVGLPPQGAEEPDPRVDPAEDPPELGRLVAEVGGVGLGGLQPDRDGRDPDAFVEVTRRSIGRQIANRSSVGARGFHRCVVQGHRCPVGIKHRAARGARLGRARVLDHEIINLDHAVVAEGHFLGASPGMLDDKDDFRRRDVQAIAVECDRAQEVESPDAAEGEVEFGVGDEEGVGVERDRSRPARRGVRRRCLVIGQHDRQGGCRLVGQDVVVGQQDPRRHQKPGPRRAVAPEQLHHGSTQPVARPEEMKRQQCTARIQDQFQRIRPRFDQVANLGLQDSAASSPVSALVIAAEKRPVHLELGRTRGLRDVAASRGRRERRPPPPPRRRSRLSHPLRHQHGENLDCVLSVKNVCGLLPHPSSFNIRFFKPSKPHI